METICSIPRCSILSAGRVPVPQNPQIHCLLNLQSHSPDFAASMVNVDLVGVPVTRFRSNILS